MRAVILVVSFLLSTATSRVMNDGDQVDSGLPEYGEVNYDANPSKEVSKNNPRTHYHGINSRGVNKKTKNAEKHGDEDYAVLRESEKRSSNYDVKDEESIDVTTQNTNNNNNEADKYKKFSYDNGDRQEKRSKIKNTHSDTHENLHLNDIENDVKLIKRDIKKLTKEELDELLNNLSDSKRDLLNKIIASSSDLDITHKREITKRSRINQSLQGSDPKVKNFKEISNDKENANHDVLISSKNNLSYSIDRSESYNNGNPAEYSQINDSEDPTYDEYKNDAAKEIIHSTDASDQEYYDEEEDPCSSVLNKTKKDKRDVSEENNNLSDSLKSLADSFPNSNANNEVDSNLKPHVRVKRKNRNIEKRDISISCNPQKETLNNVKEIDNNESYESLDYTNENDGENPSETFLKVNNNNNKNDAVNESNTISNIFTKYLEENTFDKKNEEK